MNFLAHIVLSGDNEDLQVGNFIGDFVKGAQIYDYPPDIQKGVAIHRAIDDYTDSHEVVLKSKKRLRDKYHHYAPVIVDLYYDHLLAKNWGTFISQDLLPFTLDFYQKIKNYHTILPRPVKTMLVSMESENWLYNYRTMEGINQALNGMARRTRFESKMEEAATTLQEYYSAFEEEFLEFFPQLQYFVKKQIT